MCGPRSTSEGSRNPTCTRDSPRKGCEGSCKPPDAPIPMNYLLRPQRSKVNCLKIASGMVTKVTNCPSAEQSCSMLGHKFRHVEVSGNDGCLLPDFRIWSLVSYDEHAGCSLFLTITLRSSMCRYPPESRSPKKRLQGRHDSFEKKKKKKKKKKYGVL